MTAQALADAATALVGTPYRLHGRDPATGLDCVGVLSAALQAIGKPAPLPNGYRLRMRRLDGMDDFARRCDLTTATGDIAPGDVVMMRPSPCQYHLLIAAGRALFVHANAKHRRVTIGPAPPDWPVAGHWRFAPKD